MSERILLRARSGPEHGMGHVMRTRSVAEASLERGDRPLLVVDDGRTGALCAGRGFEVVTEEERPDWATEPAAGAWLDGYEDWSEVLPSLESCGTPVFLVENRSSAREACERLVYPALHWVPDAWDRSHSGRVLSGARWIPLAREVCSARSADDERDVDLLITFGGSDPLYLTERVLTAIDLRALHVVVSVGAHMAERRQGIADLAEHAASARVLASGESLAAWMPRARAAVTALGTTLYELAYLGTPALVVADHASDREALDCYGENGPHLPLGIGPQLSCEGLRAALRRGLAEAHARGVAEVPELGGGAPRLAALLARDAA